MVCDYYETTTLTFEYEVRGELFIESINYSTEKGYIFPLPHEDYDECLNNVIKYKSENTSLNKEHYDCVYSYIMTNHDFTHPNENFISQYDEITDEDIQSFNKINKLLFNKEQNIKQIIESKNKQLLLILNQENDIKINKIIYCISRSKRY
jgi:hypothetical protein